MPSAPSETKRLSDSVARMRSQLGPTEFAAAVRRGATLRDWEIVAFVSEQIGQLTTAAAP
jgi:hypothetical protein